MKTKVEVFEELIYKIFKVKVELAEAPDGDDAEMQNITTVEHGDPQH